jgi:hypothetical protein
MSSRHTFSRLSPGSPVSRGRALHQTSLAPDARQGSLSKPTFLVVYRVRTREGGRLLKTKSFPAKCRNGTEPQSTPTKRLTPPVGQAQAKKLRALGPVLTPSPFAAIDPCSVQSTANDVVPDSRQVLYAAAPNQDDGMLLQCVPLARDVGRDLHPIRQSDAGHLTKSGIRLLGCDGADLNAYPELLRAAASSVNAIPQGVPHI